MLFPAQSQQQQQPLSPAPAPAVAASPARSVSIDNSGGNRAGAGAGAGAGSGGNRLLPQSVERRSAAPAGFGSLPAEMAQDAEYEDVDNLSTRAHPASPRLSVSPRSQAQLAFSPARKM